MAVCKHISYCVGCSISTHTVWLYFLICFTPCDCNLNLHIKNPMKGSNFKHRAKTEIPLENILQESTHTGFQKYFKHAYKCWHKCAVAADSIHNATRSKGFFTVPQLRQLVASLSSQRTRLDPRPVHVGFAVDNVAIGQVFLWVLRFSPVSTIPAMLPTH
jgi:hypothetical protein